MPIPMRLLTCTLVTATLALTVACASSGSSDSPTSTHPPGTITNAQGQSFTAGKLGKYTVGTGHSILLGPPFVFDKSNINQFNF